MNSRTNTEVYWPLASCTA